MKKPDTETDLLRIFVAAKKRVGSQRFSQDPATTTLRAAKVWLAKKLNDGAECPCCGRHSEIYKRSLNSAMVFVLILIDRSKDYNQLHVPSYINAQVKNPKLAASVRGDWAKLVHWGLIEETRRGCYRITEKGRLFVRNRSRVPKHVWVYDGEALDQQDTETVSVVEALGDKFDYSELMGAR